MHVPQCVSVQKYLNEIIAASFFRTFIFVGFIVVVVASVDSLSLRFIFNVYVCPIVYDFCWVFCLLNWRLDKCQKRNEADDNGIDRTEY